MRSGDWFRRSAILVVTALALHATASARLSHATERDGFTVSEGPVTEREYPGFTASSPNLVGTYDGARPDDCRTVAYCDTIPLTMTAPALGDDDFFVKIELNWPAGNNYDANGMATFNDSNLEMTLWRSATDPEPEAETRGLRNPESILLRLGDREVRTYLLVVANAVGTTPRYTLKGQALRVRFDGSMPEDLSDQVPRRPSQDGGPASPSETPDQGLPGTASGPVSSADGATPGAVAGAPTFGLGNHGPSAVDLAVEDATRSSRRAPRDRPVPEAPSSTALLAWLVVVPVAVVAGERALLARRRAFRSRVT